MIECSKGKLLLHSFFNQKNHSVTNNRQGQQHIA